MAAWLNELVRGSLVNVVIQHGGMAHLLLHCHLALIAAAQDAVEVEARCAWCCRLQLGGCASFPAARVRWLEKEEHPWTGSCLALANALLPRPALLLSPSPPMPSHPAAMQTREMLTKVTTTRAVSWQKSSVCLQCMHISQASQHCY